VEGAALVVEGLPQLPDALLARAEGAEVLHRLGDRVPEQPDDDPPSAGRAGNLHVEVDLVSHLLQVVTAKRGRGQRRVRADAIRSASGRRGKGGENNEKEAFEQTTATALQLFVALSKQKKRWTVERLSTQENGRKEWQVISVGAQRRWRTTMRILGPEIGILGWSSHYLPFAEDDAKKRKEDS
jgi:hypothetical protein